MILIASVIEVDNLNLKQKRVMNYKLYAIIMKKMVIAAKMVGEIIMTIAGNRIILEVS